MSTRPKRQSSLFEAAGLEQDAPRPRSRSHVYRRSRWNVFGKQRAGQVPFVRAVVYVCFDVVHRPREMDHAPWFGAALKSHRHREAQRIRRCKGQRDLFLKVWRQLRHSNMRE